MNNLNIWLVAIVVRLLRRLKKPSRNDDNLRRFISFKFSWYHPDPITIGFISGSVLVSLLKYWRREIDDFSGSWGHEPRRGKVFIFH